MARGDPEILTLVLRELAGHYRSAGKHEQADRVAEELALVAPGAEIPESNLVLLDSRSGMSRKFAIPLVSLACVLVVAICVFIWTMAGQHYAPTEVPVKPSDGIPASPPDGHGSSPGGAGADSPPTDASRMPALNAPGLAQPNGPVLEAGTGSRKGTTPLSTADRDAMIDASVGMYVHVAIYKGVVDGKTFEVELPISMGTCFAVGRNGIMLTNRHVTSPPDRNQKDGGKLHMPAENLAAMGYPTLSLRETRGVVGFAAGGSTLDKAEVLHESSRYDLAVIRVERTFDQPFPLDRAKNTPVRGQNVLAVSYPGKITEFLAQMDRKEVGDRIVENLAQQRIPITGWFSADEFKASMTDGVVSTTRQFENATHLQITAAVSPGSSGGPVLDDGFVVIGIVKSGLDAEGRGSYNFALAISQLLPEIDVYLKQP